MKKQLSKHSGFSLVEMAIVLVIVGLLLSGGVTILSSQQQARSIQDTNNHLENARESLIGYAAAHPAADNRPFLPCPDKTTAAGAGVAPNLPNDGVEDRTAAGACVTPEGNLPWVTLGLTDGDSWGNRLRYRVTAIFSNSLNGMALASAGDITIIDAATPVKTLATTIPAIILSHGKNGFGAQNAAGGANPAPAGASELENSNAANTTFISNPPVGAGGAGGEFDDLVIWLSPNILFNRMIAAGRLP